jgi:signal peptidase I
MQTRTIRHSAGQIGSLEISCSQLVPLIIQCLARGSSVRMTVKGSSMLPFIRGGDTVELSQITSRGPQVGRIYFARMDCGSYAIHRLVRITQNGMAVLQGDNNPVPDPPVPISDLVAELTCVIRDGREINPYRGTYWLLTRIWLATRPFSRQLIGARKRISRLSRRLWGRLRRSFSSSTCKTA